eukprot:TRINITY_DN7759_c0_g2_i4.p1 TRINITY_DN7759_c0_g2~~TRINITY_DN7759_c0_g2_i4.p1  ORF type:complete len:581 (-),score=92.32 TRINITY_DN7759_c0_g2_i4:2173-3915(-)
MLTPVSKMEVDTATKKRGFGFSNMRFSPKLSGGVRPIVNLSSKKNKEQQAISINNILRNVKQIIAFEATTSKKRQEERLGGTVSSGKDIFLRLKPFVQNWKSLPSHIHHRLFMVSVDIKGSFDTLNQKTLFDRVVLPHFFSSEEYVIQKYVTVGIRDARVMVEWNHVIRNPTEIVQFHDFCLETLQSNQTSLRSSSKKISSTKTRKSVVFIDNIVYRCPKRKELIELLRQHIFHNFIKIPNSSRFSLSSTSFFRQSIGIPQGSTLSSLLCNLCYADLERVYFQQAIPIRNESKAMTSNDAPCSTSSSSSSPEKDIGLLMRMVDDFFYVTTSPNAADFFLKTMEKGFPEYGAFINPKKTRSNFKQNTFTSEKDETRIKWCGFLFNSQTLEISRNYQPYEASFMSETLTVETSYNPGDAFRSKMRLFASRICEPLLLDAGINSEHTVHMNLIDEFTVLAMRFHCYAKQLPSPPPHNPNFFFEVIQDAIETTVKLIVLKTPNECKKRGDASFECCLSPSSIRWIGLETFRRVLSKKQSRYYQVLRYIQSQLDLFERSTLRKKQLTLIEAIFSSPSSLFHLILY